MQRGSFPRWIPLLALLALACAEDGAGLDPSSNGDGSGGAVDGSGGTASGDGHDSDVDHPPEEPAPTSMPNADHPYFQYFGRWDQAQPGQAVARWGAVYIKARFSGTSCTLRLADEQLTVPGGFGTGNIYQYQIDDAPFVKLSSSASTEYVLATNLSEGDHEITVVRLTESKFGATTFLGLTLDESASLLPPHARPERRIEIYGDSISAGLANENGGDYRNVNENGYEAFGPEVARLLDAEWSVEARGGGSLLSPTWLPMIPWFDKTFGPLELQHLPDEGAKLWNFSLWQPHVFILALGTNDSSEMYPAKNEAGYVTRYQGFLDTIREKYPDTVIFALAPFKEGEPWDYVRSHIQLAVDTWNDPNVYAVIPVQGTDPDYSQRWLEMPADYVTGDEYHPNLQGNDKIAQHLAELIATQMGW